MIRLLSQNLPPLDIFIGSSKQQTWHHIIQNVEIGNRHDDIIILILIINHNRHHLSSSSSSASTSIDYSNNNQGGRDRLIEGSRGILQVIWTCFINTSGYVFFFNFFWTKSRQQTQQTNNFPQGTTAMLISFDASQVYWTPSLFAHTNTNTEANTITY